MPTLDSDRHRKRPWCNEYETAVDACAQADRTCVSRLSPTEQARQSHEIRALKRELLEQRKLIGMLLTLVDPEDVKAAVELKHIVRPTAQQLNGLGSGQPPGLDDDLDEERPW